MYFNQPPPLLLLSQLQQLITQTPYPTATPTLLPLHRELEDSSVEKLNTFRGKENL